MGMPSTPFTVRVTDFTGAATDEIFTIDVTNAPPAIGLTGAASVGLGEAYPLTSARRTLVTTRSPSGRVDWGDGTVEIVSAGAVLTLSTSLHGRNSASSTSASPPPTRMARGRQFEACPSRSCRRCSR